MNAAVLLLSPHCDDGPLSVGAALCLVSYRLMVRIGRLPVETRVLS